MRGESRRARPPIIIETEAELKEWESLFVGNNKALKILESVMKHNIEQHQLGADVRRLPVYVFNTQSDIPKKMTLQIVFPSGVTEEHEKRLYQQRLEPFTVGCSIGSSQWEHFDDAIQHYGRVAPWWNEEIKQGNSRSISGSSSSGSSRGSRRAKKKNKAKQSLEVSEEESDDEVSVITLDRHFAYPSSLHRAMGFGSKQ
ncbi:hypothetical protein HDV00_006809 [Rhizophlyctis rosea]|nr:hypothetical protein HDV00_006809 [Rhizophlyctis rosea]